MTVSNQRPLQETGMKPEHTRDSADYARLSRRYVALTWGLSAGAQRERSELHDQLLKLHATLYPDSSLRWYDDFDAVLRRGKAS